MIHRPKMLTQVGLHNYLTTLKIGTVAHHPRPHKSNEDFIFQCCSQLLYVQSFLFGFKTLKRTQYYILYARYLYSRDALGL